MYIMLLTSFCTTMATPTAESEHKGSVSLKAVSCGWWILVVATLCQCGLKTDSNHTSLRVHLMGAQRQCSEVTSFKNTLKASDFLLAFTWQQYYSWFTFFISGYSFLLLEKLHHRSSIIYLPSITCALVLHPLWLAQQWQIMFSTQTSP